MHENRGDARFESRQPGRDRLVSRGSTRNDGERALRGTKSSLSHDASHRLTARGCNHHHLNRLDKDAQSGDRTFKQGNTGQLDEGLGQIPAQPDASSSGNNNHRNGALSV
jgi:hypothetical protein